jgi:ABC-type Fe3+ transport system permease subunit
MSQETMITHSSFWKKLYSNEFTLCSHVTYKHYIDKKARSFSNGLQARNLAKQIKMTCTLLCSFSMFVSVAIKPFRKSYEINHEAVSTKYYDCMSAFLPYLPGKQSTSFLYSIILSCLASLAVLYFSTLSHKRHDFESKCTEPKTCVLIFSTTFAWKTSHSKKNAVRYYHKCT